MHLFRVKDAVLCLGIRLSVVCLLTILLVRSYFCTSLEARCRLSLADDGRWKLRECKNAHTRPSLLPSNFTFLVAGLSGSVWDNQPHHFGTSSPSTCDQSQLLGGNIAKMQLQ